MTFTWWHQISNGYRTGSQAAGYYAVSLDDIQSSHKKGKRVGFGAVGKRFDGI